MKKGRVESKGTHDELSFATGLQHSALNNLPIGVEDVEVLK